MEEDEVVEGELAETTAAGGRGGGGGSSEVVLEQKWTPPKPDKLDWRACKLVRRTSLAKDLAILNVEHIKKSENLELGTVNALLGEVLERVGTPPGVVVVEPSVAVAWAREGGGEDAPSAAPQADQQSWHKRVLEASHLLIAVHSEAPAHYTYLKVSKRGDDKVIEYRDSLKVPSASGQQAATRILRKLAAIGPDEDCPPSANTQFQVDGWSCGLWVARWIERDLRELRGEGRQPPVSITLACARGNEFIQKLQDASDNPAAKAKAKGKAKGKAKAQAATEDPLAKEPKHASLEDAMAAAAACTKCIPLKDGSKGCRGCMGEHFEEVRRRGFLARSAKDLEAAENKQKA